MLSLNKCFGMKQNTSILLLFVTFIFCAACKKEAAIPSYEPGRGRITGTTSTGYSFDIEKPYTLFTKLSAANTNGDNTDNLVFGTSIDLVTGKYIQVTCGRFKGEKGEYRLAAADPEYDGAYFTEQNSPQVDYFMADAAGEYSRITFTRIKGTYVEGTYIIRLATAPNLPPVLRIEGTFQGNYRIN
jgi:hypothetical protein